ncbi:MAG: TetR/AcrR family transcriptional regulator [Treponema sp.]|nr:TetR/AcrR family transcriptional regulator [Treponema sp.]
MAEYIRARTQDQKEERMNEIKKITDELFKTHPYHEITLSTIAEKLSWSRANLYKYATTKEEIFLEIVADNMCEYFTALIASFPENNHFCPETVAELWSAIINAHQDYFRYSAYLLTIIERNVSFERLKAFKKKYYDFAAIFLSRLEETLNITKEKAEALNSKILTYASSYTTSCINNPLIVQALKELDIKILPRDFYRDIKDFVLMNVFWAIKQ